MSKNNAAVVQGPNVRYGIYNTARKSFQFHICEPTPEAAMRVLIGRIGPDARKPRFRPRPIPGYRPYPRSSVSVSVDPAQLDVLEALSNPPCGGDSGSDACPGRAACPYAGDPGLDVSFAPSGRLSARLVPGEGRCAPGVSVALSDAGTGRPIRTTPLRRVARGHYAFIHDFVIYDVFLRQTGARERR